MEIKSLVCPHCGANTTNAQNCEYCGSLLVRFVDKGIDISNTSYLSGTCEYAGLLTELKNNLRLQAENPNEFVCTDIIWKEGNDMGCVNIGRSGMFYWGDDSPINLGSKDGGLIVAFSYDTYVDADRKDYNRKMDRLLSKFKQLKSFPLFTSHFSSVTDTQGDERYGRGYAIDFGKDAEGAAALISEILSEVEGLKPTDDYDIMTNAGSAQVERARMAWHKAHGFEYNIENNSSNDGCADLFIFLIVSILSIGATLYSVFC